MRLREAVPRDRKGILEIASRTWHDWDYVPLFLDQWIAEGGLFVAEDDGEIIGMTKTTEISPGELWLEAIRVASDRRKKGLGRWIAEEQLRLALDTNPRSIRLSTADINTASLKIIHHLGFRDYATFDFYRLGERIEYNQNLDFGKIKLLTPESKSSIKKSWNRVSSSEEYRLSKGLFPHTWKFPQWTEELYRILIRKGYVFVTGDNTGAMVLLPNRYSPQCLELAFLEGEDTSIDLLGNYALKRMSTCEDEEYRSSAFIAGPRKRAIFERLGFRQREDLKKVFVFDYRINM